ncbi:MAG TPA: hypothetical protein VIJ52_00720 [Pseudolabrys sp.]
MTANTIDPTLTARLQEFIGALNHDDDALWVEGEVKLSVLAPTFGPLTRAQVRASGAIRRVAEAEPVAKVVIAPGSVEEAEAAVTAAEAELIAARAKTIASRQRAKLSRGKLAEAVRNWSAAFPVRDANTVFREHIKKLAEHKEAGNVVAPTRVNGSPLDTFIANTKPGSGGRANDPFSFRRGGNVRRLPSSR